MQERLQKIIARAGIASRRHAEMLIQSGVVTVNGRTVTELGSKADAESDHIKVAGKLLRFETRPETLVLHKPGACVAALTDPEGRQTLRDFLQGVAARVYPVGGLEYHAAGLVLLTSDGALANRLIQGKGTLPQTWWVKIKGVLSDEERRTTERESGARIRVQREGENAWYVAELPGGRIEQLKNAMFRSGHPVEKLRRVKLGPVELGKLPPATWRKLEPEEIRALERALLRPARAVRETAAPRREENSKSEVSDSRRMHASSPRPPRRAGNKRIGHAKRRPRKFTGRTGKRG